MKLHRDLGVTQKTAWALAQRIRQGWIEGGDKLDGEIEVDETYTGGKEKNRHANKKLKVKKGTVGITAVIGAKQRGGKIRAHKIVKIDAATLRGFVVQNFVAQPSAFTDEHRSYIGLSSAYEHKSVNTYVEDYVFRMVHTDSIEGL